jgi:ELWxxDGT repeat protein
MINRYLCFAALYLASAAVYAAPSVSGNTISWPDDGWYQVQRSSDYTTVCNGGSSCVVPPGTYKVINHTTGEKFRGIEVSASSTEGSPISVIGNVISWPDDGWYQVQRSSDYATLCNGGSSCEVEPGTYKVINHTTGENFRGIEIGVPTTEISPISVNGNIISWPDDGWYQVQQGSDYSTVCNGGSSCVVEPGIYKVINHTTGEQFKGIAVLADDNDSDRDLINNDRDNCPLIYNPDQAATIGDATDLGDVCDDEDADNFVDAGDNCPVIGNPDQLDSNGNGVGDVCEACGRARLVADLVTGNDSSVPRALTVLDNKLYFKTYDAINGYRMWFYDPENSEAGVSQLHDELLSEADGFTAYDGKLYFRADDGIAGSELWVYDPAQSGATPTLLVDINPGSESSNPIFLTPLDGKLYMSAWDAVHGTELWMVDLIDLQQGAMLVAEINPTSAGSYPKKFAVLDGKLYFNAENGSNGVALWQYDPAVGTRQIADVLPETNSMPLGQVVPLNDKLYFRSWSWIDGGKFWSFDPSNPSAGASLHADALGIFTDDGPDDLVAFKNKLYFTVNSNPVFGQEVWVYDPANPAEGVTLAVDLNPGTGAGRESLDDRFPLDFNLAMVELDDKLYLNGNNGVAGFELIAFSDAGPMVDAVLAADINPGTDESFPVHLVALSNKLYFRANDGVHGQELWEYDPACF